MWRMNLVPPLLEKTMQNRLLLYAFVAFTSVGAVVIAEVHTHHGLIGGAVYACILLAFVWWLLFRSHSQAMIRTLSSPLLWTVVLVLLAVPDQMHYRASLRGHDPLTTGAALEYPARALLLHGHDPYSVTARGAPISPGPGWIILWSPVTMPVWTGILCAVALLMVFYVVRQWNPVAAGVFCLLMLLQPLFESEMINGQDLYAISLLLSAIAVLAAILVERRAALAALAVMAGFVATGRVPMIGMVAIIGYGLWLRNRRAGTLFLVLSLGTALSLHGAFFLWASHSGHLYQPLHILGRSAMVGNVPRIVSAVLMLGVLVWLWRRFDGNPSTWLLGVFAVMVALFAPQGFGEYFRYRILNWEGANYVTFPIPLLLMSIVVRIRAGSTAAEPSRSVPA
jgi:hypothetical protein